MYNIGDLLLYGYEMLKGAGIESYQLDSQLLLSKVLKKDRIYIMTNRDKEVDRTIVGVYFQLVALRKDKMPVKYILGECEFMGRNFIIKPGVLIPRPDTEILVEISSEIIMKRRYKRICDVCCGSGIIGITLALECPDTTVVSLDISKDAIGVTKENIKAMDLEKTVEVFESNLLEYPLSNKSTFDVIVSNPPYIKTKEIPNLMDDVKNYEPHLALSGGEDGLYFYRSITKESIQCLNPGGMIAFEIGWDQKGEVSKILEENGFIDIMAYKDLAGNNRVVLGFNNNR